MSVFFPVFGYGKNTAFIGGIVSTYADLPDPTINSGKAFFVSTSTGVWFINRKERGWYYSTGTDWIDSPDIQSFFENLYYMSFQLGLDNPPHQEGRIFWNDQDKCLSFYSDIQGTSLEIGQENVIRAVNKTGSTIEDGKVVFINDAQGNRPTIQLAQADTYNTAQCVIGVVTHDVLNNMEGYVTTFGLIKGLDTSSFSEGDELWLSETTAGEVRNTRPNSPYMAVRIGIVSVSHVTQGVITVCIQRGVTAYDIQGDGIVYDDLPPIPLLNQRTANSNAPTLTAFSNNIFQLTFAVGDYVFGNYELVHSYKEGAELSFHLHFATNGVNIDDRYVKYEVEATIANANSPFPLALVYSSDDILIEANTPDRTHKIVNIETVSGAGLLIGGYICYRFRRVASAGTAPTGDPFGLSLGVHVAQDTIGSKQLFIK